MSTPDVGLLVAGGSSDMRPWRASALFLGAAIVCLITLALGASPATAAVCPNEQLRQESNVSPITGKPYSAGLPDCRAYEMVSPLNKQGHDAEPDSPVGVPVAPDGEAFGFASEGAFPGSENFHFSFPITINTYLSHRTEQGWTTESSYAPANLVSFPYRDGLSSDYSPDLRSAQASCGFQGVNLGENPIAFSSLQCAMRKQRGEVWTPSARFTTVNGEGVNGQTGFLGGSANMSRLFVQPGDALLPDDTLEEAKSVGIYEISGIGTSPELRLVSVANDGTELTNLGAGIVLNNAKGKGPLLGDHREETPINGSDYQAISQSGETVFFTATPSAAQQPEGQQQTVYARVHCLAGSSSSCKEDGNNEWLETVPVSNPIPTQCTATGCPGPARTCPAEAELTKELGEATKVEAKLEIEKELGECHGFHDATYQGASADGSKVFFTTTQRLLNGDGDETGDLYEYDFTNRAGNPLTQISAGETFAGTDECGAAVSHTAGAGAEVEGVVRTSSDGSHVYFLANGVLTSKGNTWWNASGEEEHECAEPGPSNLYAYDTETGELKFVAHTISNGSGNETSGKEVNDNHRLAQTTPDGKYLVFSTPEAFAGVTKTEAARAAYRFDFTTGELTWISHAAPAGERPSECTPSDGCKGGEERSAFIAPLEATTSGAEADINDWNRAISGCPHGYSSAEQTQCPAGAYDGETIIFSSQEKLQNDDVSQAANVYEWHCASPCAHPATEGVVQMISDGRDPKGVNSIGSMTQAEERAEITPNVWQGNSGMSASGSDIFFLTHTPLVGQDTDVLADYYDARVEGGFAAPLREVPPNPPTVVTEPASSITQTSAMLNATVYSRGETVSNCHFEYGTSEGYGSTVPCASLPGSGESGSPVSAPVGSLSPNTTYHFRIVATNPPEKGTTNPGGTSYGDDQTFKTLPNLPSVETKAASAVTQTTATLNASVNPDGVEVSKCELEYGTTPEYKSTPVSCASLPGKGTSAVSVFAPVTGLAANTTYHFRISATNANGTSKGADETFTTPVNPPTVVSEKASAVTQTTATVNATVNPNGGEVTACKFEYGTTTEYKSTPVSCASLPGSGTSAVAVSAGVTGLTANTTYHFRISATNSSGTSKGSDETFKTLPNAPTVETGEYLPMQALPLRAAVNPNGGEVSECHFEYGITTLYGSSVPCVTLPGSGTSVVEVSAPVAVLITNATYHFRIVATNPGGTSYGSDQTFKAGANPPTAATGAASSVSQTSATLNATVNPNGETVSDCHFDYGITTSYGSSVPCSSLPGSGESPVAVSASVAGLSAGITYYFRIVATNPTGTSYGADQALTTLLPATLPQQVSGSQGTLPSQGVLSSQEPKTPPVPDAKPASTSLTASSSGTVSVKVTCPAGESSCTGTLTLRTLTPISASATSHQSEKRKATILTLAVGSFKVAGGHTTTVGLHLSAKGRTLLASTHALRVRAIIVAHDPAGATHTTQTVVTIRPAKAKRTG